MLTTLTNIRQEPKPFTHCFSFKGNTVIHAFQTYFNNDPKPPFINGSSFQKLWKALQCSRVILGSNRSKLMGIFVVMSIALDEKTHTSTFDTLAVHSFSHQPQYCEPQTLFTQELTIDKSCEESRMPATKNGIP